MMKRQLTFLYRYITTPGRWRRWANAQTAMMVFASAVFFTALAWTAPFSVSGNGQELPQALDTPTLTATPLSGAAPAGAPGTGEITPSQPPTPTRTPLPPEYMETNPQTIGISLGAIMVVIIVVAGAAMFMPAKEEDH